MHYEGKCLSGPFANKIYGCTHLQFDVGICSPVKITPPKTAGPIKPPPLQMFTYQWMPLTEKTGVWVPRGWDLEHTIAHLVLAYGT